MIGLTSKRIFVVSPDWLLNSIATQKLLSEQSFSVLPEKVKNYQIIRIF